MTGVLVGIALAAVPVFVVVPALLWLDRFEAEPTGLLLFAFGWGAAVATLIAILVNSTSIALLKASGGDITAAAVVIAPIVEETSKGLGRAPGLPVPAARVRRRHRRHRVRRDGRHRLRLHRERALPRAGAVRLRRRGLAATFVLRCIFGPFAHPLFTMATGVGFGIAVTTQRRWLRYARPVLGWLVAVTLHGLWNLSAIAGLRGFVVGVRVLQVPIFVAAVAFALWSRRREGRLIGRHLAVYAETGWVTPGEVQMLASMPARRRARAAARRRGGADGGERAMRGFQDDASELALLRERMTRSAAGPDAQEMERELLAQLSADRQALAG